MTAATIVAGLRPTVNPRLQTKEKATNTLMNFCWKAISSKKSVNTFQQCGPHGSTVGPAHGRASASRSDSGREIEDNADHQARPSNIETLLITHNVIRCRIAGRINVNNVENGTGTARNVFG